MGGLFKKKLFGKGKKKKQAEADAAAAALKEGSDDDTANETPTSSPSKLKSEDEDDDMNPAVENDDEEEVEEEEDQLPSSISMDPSVVEDMATEHEPIGEEQCDLDQVDKAESFQELANIEERSQEDDDHPMTTEEEYVAPSSPEEPKEIQRSVTAEDDPAKFEASEEEACPEETTDKDAAEPQQEDGDSPLKSMRDFVSSYVPAQGEEDQPMTVFGMKCGDNIFCAK